MSEPDTDPWVDVRRGTVGCRVINVERATTRGFVGSAALCVRVVQSVPDVVRTVDVRRRQVRIPPIEADHVAWYLLPDLGHDLDDGKQMLPDDAMKHVLDPALLRLAKSAQQDVHLNSEQ